MIHYIETKTTDGATMRIEVADTSRPTPGFTRSATSPTNVSGADNADAFDQLLQTIRGCANGVVDTLQTMAQTPSAASVDFSVKVDAEAGALVSKTRDEGQFKISLSWKQAEESSDTE